MEIIFKKGADKDYITAHRADGTIVNTTFPKKGCYPHDAVHVIVEKHLNFQNGFWGFVAGGMTPEEVGTLAKEGGHASSKRAEVPAENIHELLMAERTVECFEAEMWGELSDYETFRAVLNAACATSHVDMPQINDSEIAYIRDILKSSAKEWQSLENDEIMTMPW